MTRAKTHPHADHDGRDRILAAALGSFAVNGFEGTSTAGVARDAGVTQPLIHHHFGSKEGLWRAAMDQLFSEVRVFTEIDPRLPPQEAIERAIAGLVRLSWSRPELTRIVARIGIVEGPRLTYLIDTYIRDQFLEVTRSIESAQAAGIIDPALRPDLLLFFVTGAGCHLFEVAALARGGLGIDPTAESTREEFVQLVLSVLRGGMFRNPESST